MLDTYTLFGVEFNLLDLIMAILLLGTGIYCIYTSIRVRREYTFFENKVLLPGGCEPNACTDPDGFFDYIAPRLVIFGIALIFCAALDLLRGAGSSGAFPCPPQLCRRLAVLGAARRPLRLLRLVHLFAAQGQQAVLVSTSRIMSTRRGCSCNRGGFFISPRAAFAARSEIPPAGGRKP